MKVSPSVCVCVFWFCFCELARVDACTPVDETPQAHVSCTPVDTHMSCTPHACVVYACGRNAISGVSLFTLCTHENTHTYTHTHTHTHTPGWVATVCRPGLQFSAREGAGETDQGQIRHRSLFRPSLSFMRSPLLLYALSRRSRCV